MVPAKKIEINIGSEVSSPLNRKSDGPKRESV